MYEYQCCYECYHPKSAQCADFGNEKQGGRNHINHICLIVFFFFFFFLYNFNNTSSNLYILCILFLLTLNVHSKLYPISTKNWCSWSCNTVTCKINVLSRMFEFPVSISRDRWWGSTLLSKWHSDVLLSASDWPPFYQPSTLADASWYVNVILEHCWNFNSAVHPPSIHRHWRNGVFAIISSHHPVPVALPVAFYHSADVFVAVTASTSCADHRLRQFVTASFEVVTLQNCNYEPLRCGFRSLDIQWQSALPIEARRNHRTINQMLWSSHKDINGVYSPEMQVATFSVPLNNILTNQGSLHHAGLFSS